MIKCYISILLLVLTLTSCKKHSSITKDEELPAETQVGANTFGCLIDGKVYTPDGVIGLPALTASIQSDILSLYSRRKSTNEGVGLPVRNMVATGEYPITSETTYSGFDAAYPAIEGKIIITKYDKVKNIISGRFYFTGKNASTGKLISVTNGRFDINFTN
ncbi:hypothetical protein DBR40_03720 [Pedobacter sp. KBW01]|nr:hypothetical protein DBR40_03720 [Pedobacter sp. KBW01]